jgi:hypothetical protein
MLLMLLVLMMCMLVMLVLIVHWLLVLLLPHKVFVQLLLILCLLQLSILEHLVLHVVALEVVCTIKSLINLFPILKVGLALFYFIARAFKHHQQLLISEMVFILQLDDSFLKALLLWEIRL